MINDEIESTIYDVVSEWFDNHCHRDDFDNAYQRQKYLRELADGSGWNDDVADECLEELADYEWEDEFGTMHLIDTSDDDVIGAVYEQIVREAEYWID